jgi:hypothetical protein
MDLVVGRRRPESLAFLSLVFGDEHFDGDKGRHSSLR